MHAPNAAYAQTGVSVTPVVLQEKVQARDIVRLSVTLSNQLNRKISAYPTVYNIDPLDGKKSFHDPSRANLSTSLANWLLVPRGAVELLPGERRDFDFELRVNMSAIPGMYYAFVGFPIGAIRSEAEAQRENVPGTAVNVEVYENIVEQLNVASFASEGSFFSGSSISFSYAMQNAGDRAVVPEGEIRIYNRAGKEIASRPLNQEHTEVGAGKAFSAASVFDGFLGYGRMKAVLELAEYRISEAFQIRKNQA